MSIKTRSCKFKVGDKIKYRIEKGLSFLNGHIFTVSEIKWRDGDNWWGYKVKEDSSWLFSEGNLVLVYDGECNGCTSSCKGEKRCGLYESSIEKKGE